MLYNAMILPYFNYCSITWSTADQKHNIDVLERLQKRAGGMVLGSQVELVREKLTIN